MRKGKSIQIRDRVIGDNSTTYIIAEMACAHEGKQDLAHHLVDIAAAAKPDAIQLQLFSVDNLLSPFHPNYILSSNLELSTKDWKDIIAHARMCGLHVWANVFDEEALKVAINENVDVIKIHSSDISNLNLLDAVSRVNKPISLAVGGSMLDEISQAVLYLRERDITDLILMHGYQGYPTELNDCQLLFIETLKYLFNCTVGYQDHIDGASELAIIIPLIAIGTGACILEKHYTYDRACRGTDYESAINPDDFIRFVKNVREVNIAMGNGAIQLMSPKELEYRNTMKRTIVAARSIKKEEKITKDMLAFMRSEYNLSPSEAINIIGMKSRRDIPKFHTISLVDLYPDDYFDDMQMEKGK